MRKRVTSVFMVFFLLAVLLMAGWKSTDRDSGDFDQKMFLVNKGSYLYDGVYLQSGNNYYSLNDSISTANSEKYDVGISGSKVYYWFGSSKIMTVADFEPLEAQDQDMVVSYSGEVEFFPVEFVQYSFLGYVGTPGTGLYYWDYEAEREKMAFPKEACVVYNTADKAMRYDQMEQGETYTLRWNDMYGYNVVEMPPANCRLYQKISQKATSVSFVTSDDGSIEYSASDFEPGIYAVVTKGKYGPKFGGLITIE